MRLDSRQKIVHAFSDKLGVEPGLAKLPKPHFQAHEKRVPESTRIVVRTELSMTCGVTSRAVYTSQSPRLQVRIHKLTVPRSPWSMNQQYTRCVGSSLLMNNDPSPH